MREDEATALRPWLAAFQRTFGAETRVEPHPFAARLSLGSLSCLRFPPVFEPPEILGSCQHFARSKALCAHVRALGFAWDDDTRIRVSPSPETFNELLELATDGETGYRVELYREDATLTSTGPWLHRYLRGAIPMHVASGEFYDSANASRDLPWHLTTLAHDLTVHALNYHLIPRAVIRALGERIIANVPVRLDGIDRDGAIAPLTLAWFFDNDLNRYCYEVWFRCDKPADFAPTFVAEENLAQLYRALDTRIRETNEGLGDVPSGRSEDLPPLTEVNFALRDVRRPSAGANRRSDR